MTITRFKGAVVILLALNIFDFYIPLIAARSIDKSYWTEREEIIEKEQNDSFGSDIILTEEELLANETLMSAKLQESDEGFEDESTFLPRSHFLKVKNLIEQSEVFKIIKQMPKGALLHAHDVGTVSQKYVLYNITYRPNLYACDLSGKLKLKFFATPDTDCDWKLLSELRNNPKQEKEINTRIQQHMSMMVEDPAKAYPDGLKAWNKFQSLFGFLGSFMRYKPVYEDYYYQLLKENYEDKVIYIELRISFPTLYDLEGNFYKPKDVLEIIKNVVSRFQADHHDFVGVKLIYSKQRKSTKDQLEKYLKTFQELKKRDPSFIAGFDLVGHEDKGTPLIAFAEQLKALGKEGLTFYHAGETDWLGQSSDQNLIDAVLLNAKRIGHGYALIKHPEVMKLVKEKDIAIEVNPISNQILNLVSDLRNHPASVLFAENFPVVVCSDDPGLWGAKGLSYDYYEAFMGIMSRSSDLRALKKLGINSIKYSAMNEVEKSRAMKIFDNQWKDFITHFISEYNSAFNEIFRTAGNISPLAKRLLKGSAFSVLSKHTTE